jgi:hypothetical protein
MMRKLEWRLGFMFMVELLRGGHGGRGGGCSPILYRGMRGVWKD